MSACDDCLRRTDLIAALAGRIEIEWRQRRGRPQLLALADEELLAWGRSADVRDRYARFDGAAARARIDAAGVIAVCRCAPGYPGPLNDLPDPPAVLHRLGFLPEGERVAIVGARRATAHGIELARDLGRHLALAGVPVVSGMALGIDSAAHAGALQAATAPTMAVLAGGVDVPYPASKRRLHEEIAAAGAVVGEMPPGTGAYRWCFPARNRIIAALADVTVVVEGGERSGSLITADFAVELGRAVGALPGPVTAAASAGPNLLIKQGAELVRDAHDVLELLFGAQAPPASATPSPPSTTAPLSPALTSILRAVEAGRDSLATLAGPGADVLALAAGLGELELLGLVRRTAGGRYVRALG